ncbi:MAG: DUF512 domain-containing protein [Oscillospiraceae bacterium]|nr:DUF512 domain-containing protein [Oscillospiraceae bacterium]
MAHITNVIKKSPAHRAHIKSGDELVAINGNKISDVLDYMFYAAETSLVLTLERNSKRIEKKIKKDEYEDLGLEFETFLMDKKQTCCNKCIFCFIDQMPPDMRETLYFKDDDSRLSFLHGNYVTLTNLSDDDIDRIIKMKLPLNISVHTTNPQLRCKMMNNRFAGDKLKYLKKLGDNNIKMNCQIVLCPQFNDGEELDRTLSDLCDLMPNIDSIAVVPLGMTKYRDNLTPLSPVDKHCAEDVIERIEKYQQKMLDKFGTRLVFAADEFYLIAKKDLPTVDDYEGFPQYENGVGMLSLLISEFEAALDECDENAVSTSKKAIATGAAAFDTINMLIEKAKQRFGTLDCTVYKIENDFFGRSITVTGLLTAKDIINQLEGKLESGTKLLLSRSMFKDSSEIFLDDLTAQDVQNALGVKIEITDNDGEALLLSVLS